VSTGTYDTQQIEHYLLDKMPAEEREKFEERLLSDDTLFYEAGEAENAMIDRYIRGDLTGGVLREFESSLRTMPARAAKVANARALREFIEIQKPGQTTSSVSAISRLFAGLGFRSASMGFAAAGILVMFSFAAAYLFVENRRLSMQMAELETKLSNRGVVSDVEQELAASRERAAALQAQIDEEKSVTGELTSDLERERAARRGLESDLAGLKGADTRTTQGVGPSEVAPPNILAVTIPPKGGKEVTSMKADPSANRVSILLNLPPDIDAGGRFTVRLNDVQIAHNVVAQRGKTGANTISVWVPADRLRTGENLIEAFDAAGKRVSEHRLTTNR
jgi:hypothetical protein